MVGGRRESTEGSQVADRDAVRATGSPPEGRPWTVAALVLAGLGLAMFPPGGLIGIVCGAIGRSRGDQTLGLVAIVASILSFFASFVVAAWVIG
jgi:hypothetical protein